MKVIYEDNHIIIVYKESGEIVQGDKTGDLPLCDIVKDYIKKKYNHNANFFKIKYGMIIGTTQYGGHISYGT